MCADVSLVEYYPTIKELPAGERPRERLEHYGAGASARPSCSRSSCAWAPRMRTSSGWRSGC